MGSAITYARRYTLTAMLGMVTEDDDGESAKATQRCAAKAKQQDRIQQNARAHGGNNFNVQQGHIQPNDIPHAQGFYPLCAWCAANADCPKFSHADFQPQWEEAIQKLDELKHSREDIQSQITEIENALKQAHRLSGANDWIDTGRHRFRMSTVSGRKSLNQDALKLKLQAFCKALAVKWMLKTYLQAA